jgi:hypothetical protein
MNKTIRAAIIPVPSRESIMKEARDAARRYGQDNVSNMLKVSLNDIGYYQEDLRRSGFQYLDKVLKDEFTEGMPGPMPYTHKVVKRMDIDEYYAWYNNIQIARAVNQAILWAEGLRGTA